MKLVQVWRIIARVPFALKVLVKHPFSAVVLFRKVWPYTMVSLDRLENLYDLCTRAEAEGIAGSFVECGVWRGGCVGVMGDVARRGGVRKIHLFDSFEGLPEPLAEVDGSMATHYAKGRAGGELTAIGRCVGPLDDVKTLLFDILRLNPSRVVIHQGWFQQTLPVAAPSIGPIAVLRLDGDWYESTKVCLDHLYDHVTEQGFVIIDDYGVWAGCRKAVDEFVAARQLPITLTWIDDGEGVWFRKPAGNR